MLVQYSMLRLFLTQREIGSLLEAAGDYEDNNRQDYLKAVLTEEIKFSGNRGTQYIYAFVGFEEDVILGRLGRQKPERRTDGPETRFQEKEEPSWRAANVLIDTSGDNDGQKVAFQEVAELGDALKIMEALCKSINDSHIRARWHIDVNTITDESEFWAVVEANKGNITSLKMTFLAPNIFKSREQTSKNLKELHEESGVQETQVKLVNRDKNLDPDSERIRENIDYVKKGGGSYQMKSGKETLYNSEEKPIRNTIEEEELKFVVQEENASLWKSLINKLFGK